ncbi:MAG: Hsp20/alpha crystallin family protein [Thermodesulfobacteriota bacterium]
MRSLIPWKRRDAAGHTERSVGDLRREFDHFFNSFFGDERWLPEKYLGSRFSPAFDISETETDLILRAELPGVDPKDVDVTLTGSVLTIKGEKKEEREENDEHMYRMERSFGSFARSFTLPCEVSEDRVEARFKDGVLTLKLPKAECSRKKNTKIDVQ